MYLMMQSHQGAGHSDLGLDAGGQEVLIMDVYDDNANMTHIQGAFLMTMLAGFLLKMKYLL